MATIHNQLDHNDTHTLLWTVIGIVVLATVAYGSYVAFEQSNYTTPVINGTSATNAATTSSTDNSMNHTNTQ